MKLDSALIIAGQAIWAISQASLLLIISSNGYIDLVGVTTLALSIFAPLTLLGSLNLRTLIAIDNKYEISLINACKIRLLILILSTTITSLIIFFSTTDNYHWLISTIIIASKGPDQISDIATGHYQREKQYEKIGKSFLYRGIAGIVPFSVIFYISNNLIIASITSLVSVLAASIFYDVNSIVQHENKSKQKNKNLITFLFKNKDSSGWSTMFPVIDSLHLNSFRYAIYMYSSSQTLGVIGIAQTLFSPVQLFISAMGYKYLSKAKSITETSDSKAKKLHIKKGILLGIIPILLFIAASITIPSKLLLLIISSNEINPKTAMITVGLIMLPLAATSFTALNLIANNNHKIYTLAPIIGVIIFWLALIAYKSTISYPNIFEITILFIISGAIRLAFVCNKTILLK